MIISMLLISVGITTYSQDATTKWINENAYPLQPDTAQSTEDLHFLKSELKHNLVIGLGEASHGTREFYNQKQRIISYLITHLGYKRIGFEMQDKFLEPVNAYVQNGTGDLKVIMKDMVLYNTEEIYHLFQSIRQYNNRQPAFQKVSIYGFDREEFAGDPFNRDRLMAENMIADQSKHKQKTILWAHNIHIAKDTIIAQYRGMGYHVKQQYGAQFYVLGFDTFNGSVTVISQDEGLVSKDFTAPGESFSEMFSKASHPTIYIPFNKAPNPLTNQQRDITNIYANWTESRARPIKPGVDFDAILFIKTTSASRILK
ncbi:erythromycin esterase family protein [Chitinophaga deserti]|uniref:erythromycin esterase family protein n=1 Tax=Chitinophaga deserti TaxID=2164099 RepID=UPI0018E4E320|nr:erythromycin esterase family protein [Chitinophaga deserti]